LRWAWPGFLAPVGWLPPPRFLGPDLFSGRLGGPRGEKKKKKSREERPTSAPPSVFGGGAGKGGQSHKPRRPPRSQNSPGWRRSASGTQRDAQAPRDFACGLVRPNGLPIRKKTTPASPSEPSWNPPPCPDFPIGPLTILGVRLGSHFGNNSKGPQVSRRSPTKGRVFLSIRGRHLRALTTSGQRRPILNGKQRVCSGMIVEVGHGEIGGHPQKEEQKNPQFVPTGRGAQPALSPPTR